MLIAIPPKYAVSAVIGFIKGKSAIHLATIGATPHAAVSVWSLTYRRADVMHPLDGFGVLVPARERRTVLGVLFSSSMFPARCPDQQVLLSAFVRNDPGGSPAGLAEVEEDLRRILGVNGGPMHVEVHEHAGIPLKGSTHRAVLDAAEQVETEHTGLTLAGSWRSGVAVGDCLVAGARAGLDAAVRLAAL